MYLIKLAEVITQDQRESQLIDALTKEVVNTIKVSGYDSEGEDSLNLP